MNKQDHRVLMCLRSAVRSTLVPLGNASISIAVTKMAKEKNLEEVGLILTPRARGFSLWLLTKTCCLWAVMQQCLTEHSQSPHGSWEVREERHGTRTKYSLLGHICKDPFPSIRALLKFPSPPSSPSNEPSSSLRN